MPLSELQAALTGAMIEAHYQPIVRLADRKPIGVEALARMNHPTHGRLLPHHFVPQMEDAGLAPALTEMVTRRAFSDMAGLSLAPHGLEIALNFPLDVLLMDDAFALLDRQRREAGIAAERVLIELTESQPVDDPAPLRRAVDRLRDSGYGIAIDDVQPGVPQLQALLDLPFTSVKLDKDLVQLLQDDPAARDFTRGIVDLAQARGLTVTAEGVEDTPTWDQLEELGVDMAQGFLMARPMVAVAVPVWLQRWSEARPPE